MWYLIGFAYLLVGISVFRYIDKCGDKLHISLLWLSGWGVFVSYGLCLALIYPIYDLFKYIKSKCKTQH